MASVIKDSNGRKRIQFVNGDGKRKTIRLGKCEQRQAVAVCTKIEALQSAGTTGVMDGETSRWLAALDDRLHQKLAHAGLTVSRDQFRPTLEKLLTAFFTTVSVKPQTLTTYKQTRTALEKFFPADRQLATITKLDCDQWRKAMEKEKLAEATISKRVKTARQIFRMAVRWKMVAENPLAEVKTGSQKNPSRMYFISRADAEKVLAECPDAEWRLIFALSRFGGLRCPSEHLGLKWQDIDWERNRFRVRSPKTEGHDGGHERFVPIFPELKPHLLAAFELAQPGPGSELVITRYRQNSNLRTQMTRILKRAGLKVWPRLFHNLRSSRQTELAERHPIHVVCAWLGNSPIIAQNHYLQVRESDFADAVRENTAKTGDAYCGAHAAQIAAQHPAESVCTESQIGSQGFGGCEVTQKETTPCTAVQGVEVTPMGFEPMSPP